MTNFKAYFTVNLYLEMFEIWLPANYAIIHLFFLTGGGGGISMLCMLEHNVCYNFCLMRDSLYCISNPESEQHRLYIYQVRPVYTKQDRYIPSQTNTVSKRQCWSDLVYIYLVYTWYILGWSDSGSLYFAKFVFFCFNNEGK